MDKPRWAALGGLGAGIVSALCCVGPLVAVSLGVSGAWLASTFEPLRPYLLTATAGSLGFAWYSVAREDRRACEPGTLCASPTARRRIKRWLWVATAIAVVFGAFPWWSKYVLT